MTEEQRENLRKLADYLSTGKTAMRFDMISICVDKEHMHLGLQSHECGTVACALGHGPAAGMAPKEYEDWPDYRKRCFGVSNTEWFWVFSGMWRCVDNTPEGAAKRIYWMLEHGVPKDYLQQMYGEAPLCYRNND